MSQARSSGLRGADRLTPARGPRTARARGTHFCLVLFSSWAHFQPQVESLKMTFPLLFLRMAREGLREEAVCDEGKRTSCRGEEVLCSLTRLCFPPHSSLLKGPLLTLRPSGPSTLSPPHPQGWLPGGPKCREERSRSAPSLTEAKAKPVMGRGTGGVGRRASADRERLSF